MDENKTIQKYTFLTDGTVKPIKGFKNINGSVIKDIYHQVLTMSWAQFFISLTVVYFSINFIFGCIYFFLGPGALSGQHSGQGFHFFLDCFFFSVQTFSTIGYGVFAPMGFVANFVVSLQALMGMLSIGLMSGLFFSRFARATARIVYSDQILLTQHMGQKSLMFRIANARVNRIIDAKMTVSFSYLITTAEGTTMRIVKDLKLVRDTNTAFIFNWVIVHVIDESSPLFNLDYDQLEKIEAEFYVSVVGYDEHFSQMVHSRKIYLTEHLECSRYFVDMVKRDGRVVEIDLSKISILK